MSPETSELTTSTLLAAAEELLRSSSFAVTRQLGTADFPAGRTLLAEDPYSVVALVVFDTWTELETEWPSAQAELVQLLISRLAKSAPKVWDAYLVLLCAASAPTSNSISLIERDTTRVRKVVATGDTLHTVSDIARTLDPFMPLDVPSEVGELVDVLSTLPSLLAGQCDPAITQVVVDAFRNLEPPLEKLHSLAGGR